MGYIKKEVYLNPIRVMKSENKLYESGLFLQSTLQDTFKFNCLFCARQSSEIKVAKIGGEVKGRTGSAPADQMKGPEGHARVRPEHL